MTPKLLTILEQELSGAFNYQKPLQSDDLSEDARIIRAFYCKLAIEDYQIPIPITIAYLRYGTPDAIDNVLRWVKNELFSTPDWNKVLNIVKDRVNAKLRKL